MDDPTNPLALIPDITDASITDWPLFVLLVRQFCQRARESFLHPTHKDQLKFGWTRYECRKLFSAIALKLPGKILSELEDLAVPSELRPSFQVIWDSVGCSEKLASYQNSCLLQENFALCVLLIFFFCPHFHRIQSRVFDGSLLSQLLVEIWQKILRYLKLKDLLAFAQVSPSFIFLRPCPNFVPKTVAWFLFCVFHLPNHTCLMIL